MGMAIASGLFVWGDIPPAAIVLDTLSLYNLWVVSFSYVLASFGAYLAINVLDVTTGLKGGWRHAGTVLGSVVMASAVWSMHYTGMLAYRLEMDHEYDFWLTVLSGVIAFVFALGAFLVLIKPRFRHADILWAAPLLGLGVAAMHYTGMAAMRMEGQLAYLPGPFLLSVGIAVAASAGALALMDAVKRLRRMRQPAFMIAALVMGIAVCGMHYTGMAATVILPHASHMAGGAPAANGAYASDNLALLVGLAACVVMGMAFGFLILVRKMDGPENAAREMALLLRLHYVGLAFMLGMAGMVAWVSVKTSNDIQRTFELEKREHEIHSSLSSHSQTLEMAARMALATGNPSWEADYQARSAGRLRAAGEAAELLSANKQSEDAAAMMVSIGRLSAMEAEAFRLARTPGEKAFPQGYDDEKERFGNLLGKLEQMKDANSLRNISGIYQMFEIMAYLLVPFLMMTALKAVVVVQSRRLTRGIMREKAFVQDIMDAIADPIFVKDANHVWRAGNKAFWKMMGGGPEKFLGKGEHDIFPDAEVEVFWERDNKVIGERKVDVNVETVTNHEGHTIIAETTKSPLTLPDGGPGLVGIVHDITHQKEAERQLALHRDHRRNVPPSSSSTPRRHGVLVCGMFRKPTVVPPPTQGHVMLGATRVPYTIARSARRRRSIGFRVVPGQGVLFRAPLRAGVKACEDILFTRANWVLKHYTAPPPPARLRFADGEALNLHGKPLFLKVVPATGPEKVVRVGHTLTIHAAKPSRAAALAKAWFGAEAARYFAERVPHWAQRMNLRHGPVRISDAKTRWGSCSHNNTLRFNWRLLMVPQILSDYVIVHELAHVTHKNHGPHFWALVEAYMPACRHHKKALSARGPLLP